MNYASPEYFPASSPALKALADGLVKPRCELLESLHDPGVSIVGDPELRATPVEPAQWAAQLVAEFSSEDLVATGCFVVSPSGGVELVPSLAAPQRPLLVMRQAERWSPYAVMGPGVVTPEYCQFHLMLEDWETRRRLQQSGGASSPRWIWPGAGVGQLGLPAAPVSDFASCDRFAQRDRPKTLSGSVARLPALGAGPAAAPGQVV